MPGVRETWERLGRRARIGLAAGGAAIAAFTLLGLWWVLRDEGQLLFSGLEPQEAAAVVAELERMKVDYHLADGGTAVVVPRSQADALRVKLSGSGLSPGGGVGFEIFDNSDFGVTEFAQRINFQRAMQGELARTIGSLREVKRARVHLVMPEQGLFTSRRQPPSAAVNLVLAPGETLHDDQVLGIQRMVASSVEGLEARNVTVVDQDGVTLSREVTERGDVESVSARLEKKREVEGYLRQKVADVIEKSTGTGDAVVSVDVTLAMDQTKTTVEKVVTRPDGNGWVKRQRETRNWTGPEGEKVGDGGLSTETEYDLGRSIEETVATPGGIARVSVGVLLPGPMADDEIEKIRDVVAMAVGISAKRGDSIALHAIPWPAGPRRDAAAGGAAAAAPPGTASARPAPPPAVASGVRSDPLRWWRPGEGAAPPMPTLLLVAVALALLAALWARRWPGALSSGERERVLAQLRAWIHSDGSGGRKRP